MEPLAIHHVAINVTDVPRSVAFYTEVLGGTLRADRPDFGMGGAWIDLGEQQVHLLEAPVPRNLGQHFAIRVGDLDATVAELRSKGVDIADPVRARGPTGRPSSTIRPVTPSNCTRSVSSADRDLGPGGRRAAPGTGESTTRRRNPMRVGVIGTGFGGRVVAGAFEASGCRSPTW